MIKQHRSFIGVFSYSLVIFITICAPVQAQLPYVPRPSQETLEPQELKKDTPKPELILPKIETIDKRPISDEIKVDVTKFEFLGNTVVSDKELAQFTKKYEDSENKITAVQLEAIRKNITNYYIKNGFINSGAVIPDQRITGGVIKILLVEGKLTNIDVAGNIHLKDSYIVNRVRLGAPDVLNVNELQQSLMQLQQDPLVSRLNAVIMPGTRPGDAKLDIEIDEAPPIYMIAGIDNYRSPSIGSEQLYLNGSHRNLTGNGDELAGFIGVTEGLREVDVVYDYPISAKDTKLQTRVLYSQSEVIEEQFEVLEIESESTTVALGIIHPLIRNIKDTRTSYKLSIGARLALRESQTFLLGSGFSFTPGVEDGKSKITVLRLPVEWIQRSQYRVVAARLIPSIGLDLFGATMTGVEPDGEFITLLGQFQWLERPWEKDIQLIFRFDAQYSDDPLFSMEKFVVGGVATVRGYRETSVVKDNGLTTSLEVRYPLISSEVRSTAMHLAAFIDYGRAWDDGEKYSASQELFSAGLGLRGRPTFNFRYELYWAEQLKDFNVVYPESNLQDDGIHFSISYNFY